jgi:hypothetical protein
MSNEKAVTKVQYRFDSKRGVIQEDLDRIVSERDEHIRNGDQTDIWLNKGAYAYVHKPETK